jgi:hypothetical protein
MKYPACLTVGIIAIGLVLGVIFQYDLCQARMWEVVGFVIFALSALIFGILAACLAAMDRRIGPCLGYGLLISISSLISLLVFGETGSLIDTWKVDAVHHYVARVVPVLDEIKRKEGAYPSTLPIDRIGDPPELLRKYGHYTSTSSTFRFDYDDEPAGLEESAFEFDSTARRWVDWGAGER